VCRSDRSIRVRLRARDLLGRGSNRWIVGCVHGRGELVALRRVVASVFDPRSALRAPDSDGGRGNR
jgi:hypothetical protein